MPNPNDAWMPREAWDRLVRGAACPLCAAIQSDTTIDPYGITVADLPLSRLRLAVNQYVPGYCVLICATHVIEPYHLSATDRQQFWDDLLLAAQAIGDVFAPIKMNYQVLGNAVPHLHAHLVPRYYGDAAPGQPIDPGAETAPATSTMLAERAAQLRTALAARRENAD